MAIRMDGKVLASKIKGQLLEESLQLQKKGIQPTLAVILCGDDPASAIYVRNKEKDCAECGYKSVEYRLEAAYGEEQLLKLIESLNTDPQINGILVQLPLPKGYDERKVIRTISPEKDVDAFHPVNVGKIMLGEKGFLPCTPAGIVALLEEYRIQVEGKKCVVIGRSNIVGKPMALLLLRMNGTVTITHSKTPDLTEVCKDADVIVSAVGKAGLVTAEMVKQGAVVIDVGMNRNEAGKLVGDVDYEAVEPLASFITPVPGGVGPMTRAILMRNTLDAAKVQNNL